MVSELRVLILDDVEADAQLVERELRRGGLSFRCRVAQTQDALILALKDFSPGIVLSDFHMPGFDGLHALETIKHQDNSLPVIIVTGSLDEPTAVECIKRGAADYVLKDQLFKLAPAVTAALDARRVREAKQQAEEALRKSEQRLDLAFEGTGLGLWDWNLRTGEVYRDARWAAMLGYSPAEIAPTARALDLLVHPDDRPGLNEALDALATGRESIYRKEYRLLNRAGEWKWVLDSGRVVEWAADGAPLRAAGTHLDIDQRKRAERDLSASLLRLQTTLEATIRAMASMVEMKDPYTSGHQRRVARLATAIAEEMGLPEARVIAARFAGTIHDLGKVVIPAEILSKPGRISAIEMEMIKTHPQAGYDILKGIEFPWPIADIVLQHHERMDGSGYPRGLRGSALLPEARILIVADFVEAMASHRPYRPAHGIETALAEMLEGRGTLFDAQVVDSCLALVGSGRFSFGD